MKGKVLYLLLGALAGGGIGGVVTYFYTKTSCEKKHVEEIGELRAYYENLIPVEETVHTEDPKDISEKESIAREAKADEEKVVPDKTPYNRMYKKESPKHVHGENPTEEPYHAPEPKREPFMITNAQYVNSDYDKVIMDWYRGNSYLDVKDWGIIGKLDAKSITDIYYEIKQEVEEVVNRAIRDGTIQKKIYIRNEKRSEEYSVTVYDSSYEEA